MGYDFNPALWFVCRLCKQVFPNTDDLKDHKLENHLGDCLRIKTIIFEEKLLDCAWNPAAPLNEKLQYPQASLTKLALHQINLVVNKNVNGIDDSVRGSPFKQKGKHNFPSHRIPEEIQSVAGSLLPKEKLNDNENFTSEISTDIQAQTPLSSNSHKNHSENSVVLEDGNFIVASIKTSADGTGMVQFESTNFYEIDLTNENEDLNGINEIQVQNQNEDQQQFGNISPQTEIKGMSNGRRVKVMPLNEEGNRNSFLSEGSKVLSSLNNYNSIPSPIKPSLPVPVNEASSFQQQSENSTNSKSNYILNPIALRRKRAVVTKNKNQRIHSDFDLQLHIPLKQWLLKQKNQNPSNLILLHPNPSTIVSLNDDNPIKCKLCQESFRSEIDLRSHVLKCWNFNKEHHRYCHICKLSCASHNNLKHHNETFHSVESLQQRVLKSAVQENALQAPDFSETNERERVPEVELFKCTFDNCTSSFESANSLWKHKRDNHLRELGPPEYCCPAPNCIVSFGVKSAVIRHLQMDHEKIYNGEAIIAKYPKETKRSKSAPEVEL